MNYDEYKMDKVCRKLKREFEESIKEKKKIEEFDSDSFFLSGFQEGLLRAMDLLERYDENFPEENIENILGA